MVGVINGLSFFELTKKRHALSLLGTKQSVGLMRNSLVFFSRKLTDCFGPRNDRTHAVTAKSQFSPTSISEQQLPKLT